MHNPLLLYTLQSECGAIPVDQCSLSILQMTQRLSTDCVELVMWKIFSNILCQADI
jgi:hypothetical protein